MFLRPILCATAIGVVATAATAETTSEARIADEIAQLSSKTCFGITSGEIATPGGFFVAFFALAALAVGLLELVGLLAADAVQWALFSALSVASLLFFRKPLVGWMRRTDGPDAVDTLGEAAR